MLVAGRSVAYVVLAVELIRAGGVRLAQPGPSTITRLVASVARMALYISCMPAAVQAGVAAAQPACPDVHVMVPPLSHCESVRAAVTWWVFGSLVLWGSLKSSNPTMGLPLNVLATLVQK